MTYECFCAIWWSLSFLSVSFLAVRGLACNVFKLHSLNSVELETWKEVVAAYCEVLPEHLLEGLGE
jgi:hypothetical protein